MEQKVSLQEAFRRSEEEELVVLTQPDQQEIKGFYPTGGITLPWDRVAHLLFPWPDNHLFSYIPMISS